MNQLHDVLKQYYEEQIRLLKNKIATHFWRQAFHVEAPIGWLNDPNGVLQIAGTYHLYYQYSPHDATGGIKYWGHASSSDLVHFKDEGVALYPDQSFDLHGVYSGSSFIEDGVIHYFYTGNVRQLGKHDYITTGREQNTIHAISYDQGLTIEKQNVVIKASDYPNSMGNHIRDPKVRKIANTYYMILGARDLQNRGQVLVYRSKNLVDWEYHGIFFGPCEEMGYMWECPDSFNLNGTEVLLISPQGVDKKLYRFQNIYQSGYYLGKVNWDTVSFIPLTTFQELDYGFDFYAPQTFTDEKGRQILWAWMGIPDADYENPTTKLGWQHAMILPRILEIRENKLYQHPHENYKILRGPMLTEEILLTEKLVKHFVGQLQELQLDIYSLDVLELKIKGDTTLYFSKREKILTLQLGRSGLGRQKRMLKVDNLTKIQLFIDYSSLEVFINDGEYVMTTRIYPAECEDKVVLTGALSARVTQHILQAANK